jgi:hypothetical protein
MKKLGICSGQLIYQRDPDTLIPERSWDPALFAYRCPCDGKPTKLPIGPVRIGSYDYYEALRFAVYRGGWSA